MAARPLVIRPMQPFDLDAVLEIENLSFPRPWSRQSYEHELYNNRYALIFVAEIEDRITASIVGWLLFGEFHIATIAVHPEFRQQGLARKLLQAALKDAREQGAQEATLEVRKGNTAAQALYAGFGFEIVGERPGYYGNGEDALIMTLEGIGDHIPPGNNPGSNNKPVIKT